MQKEEIFFDHLINAGSLHSLKESEEGTLDLQILQGTRDLKDIIFVSSSSENHIFHLTNGVPVRFYNGNKKDLSLVSLTKYLRQFRSIKDVRTKIIEDF